MSLAQEEAVWLHHGAVDTEHILLGEFGVHRAAHGVAPPGYVGYEEGGQLTEQVRRRPYSVVLLDEIEKAHPEIFNVLLQILEDGRLTDAQGRTVDFKNCVVIMTSNVGAPQIQREGGVGFRAAANEQVDAQRTYERMKAHVMEELRRTFRPEFLNRVDEIIVFRPLTRDQIKAIVDVLMERVRREIRGQGMDLVMTDAARDLLAQEGYDPQYGARALRRAMQRTATGRARSGRQCPVARGGPGSEAS